MKALVLKSTGSWYEVQTAEGKRLTCRMKGKLRLKGTKSTSPVAVGDMVQVEMQPEGDGLIYEIEDRKNYIIRRSVNLAHQTQVIAANLDQALLVVTLVAPVTYPRFIDRFLVTAEAYDIPAILIFNKIDLYDEEALSDLEYYTHVYLDAGYGVLHTSAKENLGLAAFREVLKSKTSLLTGHSGVGKSTLINKIEPGLQLKTATITQSHNVGRHTTTFAEMYPLSMGGYIIDSPGIKGLGLVDMEKAELGDYFPEIFALKSQCRFHNCLHIDEPGCAVKEAMKKNQIPFTRYESYVTFVNGTDEDDTYRNVNYEN